MQGAGMSEMLHWGKIQRYHHRYDTGLVGIYEMRTESIL